MGSIKEEETKELSNHHGQMSTQTGSHLIILEIRKGCVQYGIAKILSCPFLKYLVSM
jgi:hypothetical protein